MRLPTHHPQRAGFTLLEVILAAGVTSVLMLAIYQAVAMHYAVLQSGRETAERAQLARGLLNQMRRDLESTVMSWSPPDPDTVESEIPPGGVLGGQDWLMLVARVTPIDLDFYATSDLQSPLTDTRVVYSLWTTPTLDAEGQPTEGLTRQVTSRVPDEVTGGDPWGTARSEDLASEVQYLQFRYFDGVEWLPQWDESNGVAPEAIEVLIGIGAPLNSESEQDESGRTPPSTPMDEYRLVVAIPPSVAPEAGGDEAGLEVSPGGGGGGGAAP